MRAPLATLITLAACAENPSLRIEVEHDPVVASEVASTTIAVYQSDQFSCEKVEFGDLSDEQLIAGLVDEVTVGEGELEMSRTAAKVLVARGFDRDGTLFTAGCQEHGVVRENDSTTIIAHRVATVSVNGIGLEDNDPFGIVVTVTDPLVVQIRDRVVSWRVHGPHTSQPFTTENILTGEVPDEWTPIAPACTQPNGVVRIHPTPPGTIGGFATDVRVSWNSEPQRRFTTFTPVTDNRRSIPAFANSRRWCTGRIRDGAHRMVCLEDRSGVPFAVDYRVTVANGGAEITEADSNNLSGIIVDAGEFAIQVFSVVRDIATRDAYVLTNRGRVINAFDPLVKSLENSPLALGQRITDAAVMQACGASPPTLLVHFEDPSPPAFQEIRTMPVDGSTAPVPYHADNLKLPLVGLEKVGINNTGLRIAELRPDEASILRQVGVVDKTARNQMAEFRNTTTAYFTCADGRDCEIPMAVPNVSVGFLAPDDPTSDPNADPQKRPERMVSATFDASGTVLSVSVLQPGNDGMPRLVEVERITSASFPAHLVSGRFDGDGQADLFWDIPNKVTNATNFQVAYARKVGTSRLSALSITQRDLIVVDTAVADVTDDGIEDLIIMSVDDPSAPTVRQVRVIPAQAPIQDPGFVADPTCVPSTSP